MSLVDLLIIGAFLVLVLVAKIGITVPSLLGLVGALIVGRLIFKGERLPDGK
jgi:ABC-type uncharacterized transport system permease subunit